MNKFEELNSKVIAWADEKGILEKATPLIQWSKTEEEVLETREALFAKQNKLEYYTNTKGEVKSTNPEIVDGIGDTLVTILIECELLNLDPLRCLEIAYNEIKDRKGKMIGGTFVKNN